jgi:AraC-like DNA-binding protein
MSVQLKEFAPSEYLKPFVEAFWSGSFNRDSAALFSQRVLPNGYVQLIFHLSDLRCDLFKENVWNQSPPYTLIGVYAKPYVVQFQGQVDVFAIRFKPEGFYSIFGVPAALFTSSFDDIETVLDKNFSGLCAKIREAVTTPDKIDLAECFLLRKLQNNNTPITYLNRAAELIRRTNGFIRVEDLAQQSYISMRQLEREFTSKIGITPKQYIRLARLNEVHRQLQLHKEMSFTQITYQCGYADQAHFIRDFKNFTGESPKFFQREKHMYLINP